MAEPSTEIFVNSWDLYKRVVAADLMFHREIGAELRKVLRERFDGHAFSMLDLGCGDAANLVPQLDGLAVTRYKGADLAAPVLALAGENLKALSCPVELAHEDILAALAEARTYDVIHTSFALHHLPTEQKGEFFRLAARRLNKDGLLLLVDVVREADETLDVYHQRYCDWLRTTWQLLDPAEKDLVCDHIVAFDMPEPYSVLLAQAEAAGLRPASRTARFGWHRLMPFTRG
jgi:SAM-dependent methyltransferase